MIRGVAELFRVLFPALDDFPGNLEDSALALILGSEHPEGFIRLNLTAAEAGDFFRTAFFIPDLCFRNHRGIKGIFVLAGHLHNLLKISKIGTFHDGCFRADPMKEIVHNGPVDNGKVIIQIRQLFDIGTLALPAGFPFFITKRPGRNNDVIVHILLIHLLKFIKFKAHPGSLLPLPTQIVQHFKIFIPAKFDQNTIRVALDDFTMIFQPFNQIQKKKLTAHTGMDAMTHAIEAYVSTANSDFTDPLALHAIEMIQHDLIDSYNGDMAKRDAMHNAQCLAGMAFSNALLGIVHSMAHKTGAAFADYGAHIIHGAANAMYLPKVIAFNAKDETAKERYGVIADFMKLGGETLDEKVELLIKYLRGMNDDLNIPHCIKNYGADSYPTEQGFVPEEVFLERLPEIAANAILDACTGSNPRQPSQEEMEKLLKCCYYDTEVDF